MHGNCTIIQSKLSTECFTVDLISYINKTNEQICFRAIILFIVEDVTYNISDQRFHEFQIRQLCPKIKIVRKSLTNLALEEIKLGPNKELIV